MILKKDSTNDKIKNDLDWKEKNKKYLSHLQKFLDATDSIEREDIKSNVIAQMLKCDNILTQAALKEIQKYKLKMYNKNEKST